MWNERAFLLYAYLKKKKKTKPLLSLMTRINYGLFIEGIAFAGERQKKNDFLKS